MLEIFFPDLLRAFSSAPVNVIAGLLWIALLVVVIWIIARVMLAVTSVALHLLWVVAVICAVIWLVRRVSNHG